MDYPFAFMYRNITSPQDVMTAILVSLLVVAVLAYLYHTENK